MNSTNITTENTKEWSEQLSRVFIHNDLVDELKIRKEILEKKLKYKVEGGVPIISKICAEVLKKQREKNTDTVKIEFYKVKGAKRIRFLIL